MTRTSAIAIAASVAALLATPVFAQVSGKVEAASGSEIAVKGSDGKTFKAKISGSRTNVTIGGQKGDRANLKAGMDCTVTAPSDGAEASAISCK